VNRAEVAVLLERMSGAWPNQGSLSDESTIEVWVDHLATFDATSAYAALEAAIRHENYLPNIRTFGHHYSEVIRKARLDTERQTPPPGPDHGCALCEGLRWYQTADLERIDRMTGEVHRYEQWKPCQTCDPTAYSCWRSYNDEMRMIRRARAGGELFEYNPTQAVEAARQALGVDA
jgi:hypothetical protein